MRRLSEATVIVRLDRARRGLCLRGRFFSELGDSNMAWKLDGTYFENCSCEMVCPCTTSGFSAKASYDRCSFLLVFHIDRGTIEGTDVSRSEEHTSELQSHLNLVCRLLLEKKKT